MPWKSPSGKCFKVTGAALSKRARELQVGCGLPESIASSPSSSVGLRTRGVWITVDITGEAGGVVHPPPWNIARKR